MKVCLAAPSSRKFLADEYVYTPCLLESFYSMQPWLIPIVKECDFFLLDSGAFSFMNGRESTDFDAYLTSYIDFINRHEIEHFFELDVDVVTGISKVEEYRDRLERETGRQCIPVWHKSRGKDYFIDMCRHYEYVSIGGIVTKEITPAEHKYFKWFIETAHAHGCRIHGLGYTSIKDLYKYNFDSVDSTNWTTGGKFGTLYQFDGKTLITVDTQGRRRRDDLTTDNINRHNYYEWVKFQRYADTHL